MNNPTVQLLAETPIHTQNRFLAKALAFAGFDFNIHREYDAAYLRSHGCKTVKEAEKRKLAGRETWYFFDSPEIRACIAAFDSERAAIVQLVKTEQPIPFCENASAEDRCREFVRAVEGEKLLEKCLFSKVPFLRFWDNDADPQTRTKGNETITEYPASQLIRADAPEALKREMRL